jgi:hypothetical protein
MGPSARTRRLTRESLLDAEIGVGRFHASAYNIAAQRPDPECRFVIDDSDRRSALERWLLNWSPDSNAYTSGRIAVERRASMWVVRFRDAETGKERKVLVPVVGTPPPPGWKEREPCMQK